ncbi:MAG: dUTPase, partial [Frondihabitans sp.]|nr:dUTPase [Frondihabitans sp.]
MATDYDAPRKNDDDSESIEALKERVPDKMSGVVDVDDADNPGSFELAG